jgi:hypothetical protein
MDCWMIWTDQHNAIADVDSLFGANIDNDMCVVHDNDSVRALADQHVARVCGSKPALSPSRNRSTRETRAQRRNTIFTSARRCARSVRRLNPNKAPKSAFLRQALPR